MRSPLIAATVLLCTVGISACGSGGDGASGSIEGVIVASSTSDDPADCRRLHTQRFLERGAALEGAAAVEYCEEAVAEDLVEDADSVTVTEIEVDAGDASADVAFEGGGLDGQTVTVALVEVDGRWKLDELSGVVRFDRARWIEALRREMRALAERRIEPAVGECVVEEVERHPDRDLKALLTGEDPSLVDDLVAVCLARSGLRRPT